MPVAAEVDIPAEIAVLRLREMTSGPSHEGALDLSIIISVPSRVRKPSPTVGNDILFCLRKEGAVLCSCLY